MKYDTLLFLRTPGQELLHSIIRFLYLKEAIFTKGELNCLKFIPLIILSLARKYQIPKSFLRFTHGEET